MKYCMRAQGLSALQVKQFSFALRLAYLQRIKQNLETVFANPPDQSESSADTSPAIDGLFDSDRFLIQLVCKQVALSASKESLKNTSGKLNLQVPHPNRVCK